MATNSTSPPCFPLRDAVSNGVLQGNNPTNFALPLLIIQLAVVLLVTRTVAFILKPLRQPRVLAEVIGGVLLGPTVLGRSKVYLDTLFPKNSLPLVDTISTLGLLFFLFMVGLELDLKELKKSGRLAVIVGLSGILLPFIGGVGIANLLQASMSVHPKFPVLVVFLGVPISITAFPVLVRIMAEMKLLSTDLAKMVIPAAAINDVCAWILLAIGIALSGPSKNPTTPVYVLLWAAGFVLFMLFAVRLVMEKIAQRVNGQEAASEIYICVTLVGVLLSGFMTDAAGIHPFFGAFLFGLIVPKEGCFAQMLTEKVEDFVTLLLLPLFFASNGLKTNLQSINSPQAVGYLVLLVLTAAIGKISATLLVTWSARVPWRDALAFAFLMNTKGLVVFIILNVGKDLEVFDDQTFAILVVMCLILMFFTTPAVMAIYKPAQAPVPYTHLTLESSNKEQLRILACIHGARSIPAVLNLVDACSSTSKKKYLKLYAMHLIELSNRASSIMTLLVRKKQTSTDNILVAFEAYGRISKVPVKLSSAVSELANMHYDVWNTAVKKRVTLIIMPYNYYQKEDGTIEHVNSGFSMVNQRVMQNAPCSVGILVDSGAWGSDHPSKTTTPHKVAVLFFGGPDDREALTLGLRLVEHPNVKLWVLRLVLEKEQAQSLSVDELQEFPNHDEDDSKLDDDSLAHVKSFTDSVEGKENVEQSMFYEEVVYVSPTEAVLAIAKARGFALILVGREHNNKVWVSPGMEKQAESSELGVVGDALIASLGGGEARPSILVVQQHRSGIEHLAVDSVGIAKN